MKHCLQAVKSPSYSVLSPLVGADDDKAMLEKVKGFRARRLLTPLDQQYLDLLSEEIASTGSEPVQYVGELFSRHQIIFVGQGTPSRKTGLFFQELVPKLLDAGVKNIGIEWACVEDQSLLDALVRADFFDEDLARTALFRWGVRHHFAYIEYLDLFRAVWAINQNRLNDGQIFRLVALDYDIEVTAVTSEADLTSPYAWEHLRPKGSSGRHMAEIILREFVDAGEKALIITRIAHAVSRLRRVPHHLEDSIDSEMLNDRVVGAANHVYSVIADRAATILIHQPLPADGAYGDYTLPGDGYLDAVFAASNRPEFPIAFNVNFGSISKIPCSTSLDGGDLAAVAHGWIFLEAPSQHVAPTPLPNRINESNIAEARLYSLEPRLRQASSTENDFTAALFSAVAETELGWTQIV